MNNSGFYVAALFVAFLVFITIRGDLARYLAIIGIKP